MIKLIISKILFILSLVMFILSQNFNNTEVLFWAIQLIWISNIIYSLQSIKTKFIFFVFQLTFFIFIMGRITMTYMFYGDFNLNYNKEIIMTTFKVILTALYAIRIFYEVFTKIKLFNTKINFRENFLEKKINVKVLKKACKIIYWFSYIFAVIYILEKVIFVGKVGYANYYTDYSSNLPSIFPKMYSINEIVFFIYLGLKPTKVELRKISLSFILLGILCLGYGQRNPVALRFCVLLLIYYPIRELYGKKDKESWINRKFKIRLCIIIPIAILFFSFWGAYRVENNKKFSISEAVVEFFDSQGNSCKIIAETFKRNSEFPKDRVYTIGPIVDFLTNNIVYKKLFGSTNAYFGFTKEGALNGWNFGSTLSYLHSPYHYLNGIGLGSCYLAEVVKDFGFIGILGISAIYVYIMIKTVKCYEKISITSGIMLMFVYKIIYAPRDSALSFLGNVFSFTFIMTMAMIYIVYKFLKLKMIKKEVRL